MRESYNSPINQVDVSWGFWNTKFEKKYLIMLVKEGEYNNISEQLFAEWIGWTD